jgi:Helix-turn-helix domain
MQMELLVDDAQLQLRFVDSVQRRYEVIRPIILLGERTAAQRAEELHLHPDTVREWLRRFQHQGMLGLLPAQTAVVPPSRGKAVPVAVVEALAHLKRSIPALAIANSPGFSGTRRTSASTTRRSKSSGSSCLGQYQGSVQCLPTTRSAPRGAWR